MVGTRQVLVWDAPVRVFHWLMVLCFIGAYLTSESETWRLIHVTLGYTMAGLVAFRLVWGLIGTRYARFASFVRGPRAVAQYLRSLLLHSPEHYTGHNPAGALVIVGMLGLTMAIAATGWATYNDISGEWVSELHEVVANGMLLFIGVHIAGVVVSSWLHKENLPRTMVTGRKEGSPGQGIQSAWQGVAILILAAVLGFWYLQWQGAPKADSPRPATRPAVIDKHSHHHD
jgi:cytochrome b